MTARLLIPPIVAAILLGVPVLASGSGLKLIGEDTAHGLDPYPQATGTAHRPRALFIKVDVVATHPEDGVVESDFEGDTQCNAGGRGSPVKVKKFSFPATGPLMRKLPKPKGRPDTCFVNARAFTGGVATVTVQLFAKK
ncbi:MAG: hypothetical protein QOD60_2515 [Solirubrobacterales bacterium]|nr:hypothetical protein [Solirubrobacterales bacterium]